MEENHNHNQENEHEHSHHHARKQKFVLTMPIALVICVFIISLAFVIVKAPRGNNNTNNQAAAANNTPEGMAKSLVATKGKVDFAPITANDHIQGSSNPKLTIIEYSDLECPFCKRFNQTEKQMLQDYGDKVAIVYRHFPLDCNDNTDPSCQVLHSKARNEAMASECVFNQGGNDMFWKFIEGIFEITPSNNQLDPAELPVIAKDAGADVSKFNTCMKSKQTAQIVSSNDKDGLKLGIQGTPTSIMVDSNGNTYRMDGAYPYNVIKIFLDKVLK